MTTPPTTDRRLIIHVGTCKTGTTSLQNNVFSAIPDAAYFGAQSDSEEYKSFLYGIRYAEEQEVERYVAPFIDLLSSTESDLIVISDERLLGGLSSITAKRLSAYVPDATILITIRNQIESVKSFYADTGRFSKLYNKQVSWHHWLHHHLKGQDSTSTLATMHFKHINYRRVSESFEHYFSKKHVRLMLFEEMANHPEQFAVILAKLLAKPITQITSLLTSGSPQNTGRSARELRYMGLRQLLPIKSIRRMFFLTDNFVNLGKRYLRQGGRYHLEVTDLENTRFETIYGPGNRSLAEYYDLALTKWKYPGC